MRLADFEALVARLSREVPPEFLEGVTAIEVSRKTLPHPTRSEIYTLGECIPVAGGAEGEGLQSRVVLYHGSFAALARLHQDFDWRAETWETLTHELRHHLEWRARAPDLEAFDEAAEQNFARHAGEPFDPGFFLHGERVAEGVYRLDDDYFLDRVVRTVPRIVRFAWHGREYEAEIPEGAQPPFFLTIEGVEEPPPGDLVVVLRRRPRLRDLWRPRHPAGATVRARPTSARASG
jgi:hypothetical protein